MQIVSDAYKAYMSQPVRPPFHMEITVHTDTPIVYTDNEIFEFEEKKTAHPIGAELPTIEVSFKVDNIAGDYNADSPSGLYEQLIKGVKVTYRYGLEIPNVMPYGYPADEGETEEPIYGADPLNPYGFSPSSTIEWMDGGEVYTTGEISYDKTSATIEAVDALSFLEETADVAYGTINRKQCAQFIIDATEYPEDLLGAKKISIDAILETWNTNVVSDKNAKQILQSLAHASGVQIYIDRSGYLHLDKIPITTGAVDYHVTLGDQDEDGEFTKGKTARKVVVKVNTKNVVPEVSETINPRGEDIFVENDFVQTTLQAEVVLPWVKRYLAMRNTAEIEYAGDPALDILDIILLDTEYSENIPATIVESTIRFDGSITGSLVLRYDSTLADNTTVKITGAENFIYSGETPSPASVTLVCETDMTAPSYEWSYFNDSSSGWQVISGATTANLTILADSAYIVGSNPTSFRVVVTGEEGTKGTTVRIQRVQEAVQQGHTYLGKLTALPSAYDVGDYFLVSTAFSTYGLGDVVQWDGDSWEVTTNPTLIVSVYQDALTLSMPLENTSAVNQYIRSIQTKQILLSTDTPIMFFYEDDTPYDGGQVATITATRRNVISGINWYINGDLVPDYDEDTIMVYDTDMSGNEIVVTAVSVEYASVNAVIKIAKKKDRKLDASNLGLITNGDPTPTEGKDGAPLVAGDYFMWGNPTTSTPDERKKGAVYIYQTNGTWLEDTEGTKTMSMFAQFAELPNDTDSTVMGNTIIKNLVAIKAFIENLFSQNIKLLEGGSLYSDYYLPDGTINPDATTPRGAYLGADGVFKAVSAELKDANVENANVSGSFTSQEFATQKQSDSPITINKTYSLQYYVAPAFIDLIISYIFPSLTNEGPAEGLPYSYTMNTSGLFLGDSYTQIKLYTSYVEGSRMLTTTYYKMAGSVLCIYYVGYGSTPPAGTSGMPYFVGQSLQSTLSYSGYSYNSNDEIDFSYIPASDFSAIPTGSFEFSGTVTYDSTTITSSSAPYKKISRTSSSVIIQDANGTTLKTFSINDYNYYYASFNITVQSSIPGIKTMNVVPTSDSLYNLGTNEIRFAHGYVDDLHTPKHEGYPMYSCRAWGAFNGIDGVSNLISGNIASVERLSVGHYRVIFENPVKGTFNYSIDYSVVVCGGGDSSNNDRGYHAYALTGSSFFINTCSSDVANTPRDVSPISFAVFT